ncbi:uncharacterized protein BO80DRAFT_5397 [Aspergillus ibericus CBS 121593]|uniref:Uncharacterized protein n=1 Tax=Aspergillus ibericus CBS 121593 TaxID=1448316 RepID=A0A395HH13_9EURO|nr:hypothetical protein BO80DRAFT_5397 [Aspergillus ibericus CBS 121593]RAL06258.1 hypothetical protein BO80DRAFT_5397 [Aspergillus ibericus CBS 121593]
MIWPAICLLPYARDAHGDIHPLRQAGRQAGRQAPRGCICQGERHGDPQTHQGERKILIGFCPGRWNVQPPWLPSPQRGGMNAGGWWWSGWFGVVLPARFCFSPLCYRFIPGSAVS